ncbi:MAG TPA: AMP-binding protein [Candidatus Didemnitutus sp.]|nr:AMP-binding protein [Candidatus Didemnitutus sp.]
MARWRPAAKDKRAHNRRYITEASPEKFMARFAQAVAGDGEIFLGNPAWGEAERAQVQKLLDDHPGENVQNGWLMIPTGGTSGEIKFARHDSVTIGAAVRGFAQYFGLQKVNAVGVLPLFHVSGLMAWLRSALTGGEYLIGDWKQIAAGELPELREKEDGWLLSVVPTQLERLMNDHDSVEWLRGFRLIFVGGGPSWAGLREHAEGLGLSISPSYGMTETAAMVAALRPGDFHADANTYGSPMPHARIDFDMQGMISITSEAVFHGYYPQHDDDRTFYSEDFGEFDFLGRVRVLGRRDGVIITGGEKVQPSEVEGVLRTSREFSDVAVIGLPHREWGQQVVAAYPAERRPNLDKVERIVRVELSPYKRPKQYVAIPEWPRTDHGKLNRPRLLEMVRNALKVPRS